MISGQGSRNQDAIRATQFDEWLQVLRRSTTALGTPTVTRQIPCAALTEQRIALHRRQGVQATAQGVNAVTQLLEQKHRAAAAFAAVAVVQVGA